MEKMVGVAFVEETAARIFAPKDLLLSADTTQIEHPRINSGKKIELHYEANLLDFINGNLLYVRTFEYLGIDNVCLKSFK